MKATLQKETNLAPDRLTEYVTPEVNIYETQEGYLVEAEMPGVSKQGLEVTLEGNELAVIGRRNQETVPGEVVFRESRPDSYRRVFELDPAIDTTKIRAVMDQGVLKLTLPKSESVKPRRIQIE